MINYAQMSNNYQFAWYLYFGFRSERVRAC